MSTSNTPSPSIGLTRLEWPGDTVPIIRHHKGQTEHFRLLSQIALLPGAFDPVHSGHWMLAQVAERILERPVHFELSLTNVDKAALTQQEVRRRISLLTQASVLLTNAPRFVDKARLFPGCWFVVGFDTALRIMEPRYYDESVRRRDDALRQMQSCGIRFLVAGRLITDSHRLRFAQCDELPLPDGCNGLFTAIPESEFRVDLSSTQIRQQDGG